MVNRFCGVKLLLGYIIRFLELKEDKILRVYEYINVDDSFGEYYFTDLFYKQSSLNLFVIFIAP